MISTSALSELERGRSEASHTRLETTDVMPYISPSPNTFYPLRYAFYLLGDIRGKTVLDLGCGSGENIRPLLARGAKVIAVDLSPELLEMARRRLALSGNEDIPRFIEASAYELPIPDASVDAILCASLLHHLDIARAMDEMWRVLKPNGIVVVKEPVRFSKLFASIRSLFPAQEDCSEDEHPLTREEFARVKEGWKATGERAFRLPIVPLAQKFLRHYKHKAWTVDAWMLARLTPLRHFATTRTLRLEKAV